MKQTKTFSQIISEGYQYPEQIPQDLQAVIYDWYQDRHVADDDKFNRWFTRILNRNYEQYVQLLRIEPGVAKYDWLVTQYRELQREDTGSHNNSASIVREGSYTLTHDTTVTDNGQSTDVSTEGITRSGEKTVTGNDSKTINRDDAIDRTDSGTTSDSSTSSTTENTKTMVKDLPMSISYTGQTQQEVSELPLDWASATTQQGVGHIGSTTNSGSSTTGNTSNETLDSDVTESGSNSSREITSGSDSKNFSDTKTSQGTSKKTGTDVTDTEGTETKADNGTSTGRTREIYTGRQGQIASIMEKAKKFITTTNAWDWLSFEIDKAFMGVYEV